MKDKKIAFVLTAFTDPTVPLVKKFIEDGYAVDIYIRCFGNLPAQFALTNNDSPTKVGITTIQQKYYNELTDYFDLSKFRLFSIRLPRLFSKIPVIKNVGRWNCKRVLNKVMRRLNDEQYDLLYYQCLYRSPEIAEMCGLYKGKQIVGLHEVCDHSNPDFQTSPGLIKELIARNIKIVVYSEQSKIDILKYPDVKEEHLHVTRFGRYESFPYFSGKSGLSLPKKYFLFYGYVRPYKGLSLFVEAAKRLSKEYKDLTFVVAGHGQDPAFNAIPDDGSFMVIQRFLTNDEVADLVQNSIAVVCPYLSASQSGITQTSYAFNTPIIASRLDSFCQSIKDGETGLLCDVGSIDSLAEKMEIMVKDDAKTLRIRDNIKKIDSIMPEFSWYNIYNDYITKCL